VDDSRLLNAEAPIPAPCYTATEGEHNPCFVCHQVYDQASGRYRMNKLNDGHLQGAYAFSDVGETNHWSNLFVDKRDYVASVSDEAIDAYVDEDNYSGLAARLREGEWQGFIPDLENYQRGAAAFDDEGFALDGSHWVAFNYKPFPSTFWPTNGSTDDVILRLPAAFREVGGEYSRDVYQANLTLLELAIKDFLWGVGSPPVDEALVDADLNNDGVVEGEIRGIHRRAHYVGDARDIPLVKQQYPEGTQFMHSVRYVGVDERGGIRVSTRMKELRYMKKIRVLSEADLENRYARERKDKVEEKLPRYTSLGDRGFDNGLGWVVQGFIEDYEGKLRPQSYEEKMFCMGCHSAIGATIDQTFAFGRKVAGRAGWGYIDLKGMADAPSVSGGEGEILEYLRRVGGGDEFRQNREMQERWFDEDGNVRAEAVRSADVYELLTPSPERARELNKAYTYIVRHQSYIHGRDANAAPARNVFEQVDESEPPLTSEHRLENWDMRLDWRKTGDGEG